MDLGLEEMGSFFDSRVGNYEEHMLTEVQGAKQAYHEISKYIEERQGLRLIDIGVGTGLELGEIFRKNQDMKVTGIDLSTGMLKELEHKYSGKDITLHQMSYFDYDFGFQQFHAAVSCMTLHHFSHEYKLGLYTRLCKGIVPGGRYVECDYMAGSQEEEDFYYAENDRIRRDLNITEGFYHYDTPCTVENQRRMLLQAGFSKVEQVFQTGSTVILVCDK
jgi:tRNA (cmo5U34)-methyltransferase